MARSNPNMHKKTTHKKHTVKKHIAKPHVAKPSSARLIVDLQLQVAEARSKIDKRTVKYNLKLCLMEQEVLCLIEKIKSLQDDSSP